MLPTRHRAQGTSPVLPCVTAVPCVKGRVWLQLSTGRPLNSLRLLITCSTATVSAREGTGSRKALLELEGDRKPRKGRGILVLSFLLTAMKPGYSEIVPSGKFSGWQKKCILGRLIDNWRKYCFRCNKSVKLFIYHKGQLKKSYYRRTG